jgi:hypothetical protein
MIQGFPNGGIIQHAMVLAASARNVNGATRRAKDGKNGVANGIRTRNNKLHKLGLYR